MRTKRTTPAATTSEAHAPRTAKFLGGMLSALCTMSLLGTTVAAPPANARSITYSLDIPSQDLNGALQALALASRHKLLYSSELVDGKTSSELRGEFTAEQALERLLAGTHLSYEVTSDKLVLIRPEASAATTPQARDVGTGSTIRLAQSGPGYVAVQDASSEQRGFWQRLRLAQTAEAQTASEPSQSTEEDALQTITVRAEKFGRSLMNTSTSVVVLDAAALEQRPMLEGANDLLGRIPNVTASGSSNFAPAVRGVDGTGPAQGADAFLAGTRPRLNLQIDGRPASYNEVVFGDVGLWDVEQVEVLRGPQSAMQGRNAVAGTLAVKTKDPSYEQEFSARVMAGNFSNRQYSAAFSAPIVADQLAFRIAADRKSSESFAAMVPFEGVRDPREYESTTFRGKLLIEPRALEGFSTLITLNYADIKGPQGESVEAPFGDHVSATANMPVFEPKTKSAIANTRWTLNDTITLENTLAITDVSVERRAPPGTGNATVDTTEVVAEPLVRFRGLDDRLKGLGGVYFFRAKQDEFIDLFGGGTFDDSTRTIAAFGETTYAVSERFDVTLGARYEEEHRRREGGVFIFNIDLDEKYKVFLPKLVLSWHPTERLTVGTVAARGYNGGSAGFTYFPPFVPYQFDPEYVWNYEAFARASLADGKVALTANAFFSDYKDMQLPFELGFNSTVIRNADKASTYGTEVGLRWLPVRGLQLFGEVGLLKTKVDKYPDSGIEGNELPRSPSVTLDMGVSYRVPAGFEFSIDSRYSSAYYSDVLSDPRGKTDPYWLVNSQIGYTFSNVRVFGFVSNLFDSGKPLLLFTTPGEPEATAATIARPRTYGVGVQVNL